MKAYISEKAFNPISFIARFEEFIENYVKEKEKEVIAKCCKRCKKKFNHNS